MLEMHGPAKGDPNLSKMDDFVENILYRRDDGVLFIKIYNEMYSVAHKEPIELMDSDIPKYKWSEVPDNYYLLYKRPVF